MPLWFGLHPTHAHFLAQKMHACGRGGGTAATPLAHEGPGERNPPFARWRRQVEGPHTQTWRCRSENLWPMIDHRRLRRRLLLRRRSSRRPVCAPPLFVCLRGQTVGRVCVCSRLIICHTKSLARTHTYTEHWIVSIPLSLI